MPDILICVDGTNSDTYRNSSVKNFYHDSGIDRKLKFYYPGPKSTFTGADWIAIRDQVKKDVNAIARQHGEGDFFNGYQCTIGRKTSFRFILIGHSRGGHIAIHLAAMLKYRTYFMGLYDAVERTETSWDESKVIYNVDNVFHARRDPGIGSRPYFGNTGLKTGDGGIYIEEFFQTSHGGVGGDPVVEGNVISPVFAFNPAFAMAELAMRTNVSAGGADTSCIGSPVRLTKKLPIKATVCITNSHDADVFIRSNARKLGVNI